MNCVNEKQSSWNLNSELDEQITKKRITLEALDFDWIFNEGNVDNLVAVLNSSPKNAIYATKSLRVFITLIWDEYWSYIVGCVFFPYIIYMLLFVYTCHKGVGKYLSLLVVYQDEVERQANLIEFGKERKDHMTIGFVILGFWLYFTLIELMQIYRFRLEYL